MPRKSLFDTVRRFMGRPFQQDEVTQLEELIDAARTASACEPPTQPITISAAGIAIIKRFEGLARVRRDGKIEAYPDPGTGGKPWTIGWGATGPGIGKGTVWTRDQCDARLEADLALYSAEVAAKIADAPTTQAQFDALVSFHYNTGAIGRATLTRKHLAGDFAGAAREFDRWCYAGGRVMRGLARRREAEAGLYRGG